MQIESPDKVVETTIFYCRALCVDRYLSILFIVILQPAVWSGSYLTKKAIHIALDSRCNMGCSSNTIAALVPSHHITLLSLTDMPIVNHHNTKVTALMNTVSAYPT
jgi:hypothetical protein